MLAEPLPWQQEQWQQLVGAWKQSHLPHGLLLRGVEGTGKTQFALAFCQYLLCQAKRNDQACGSCKSCQLFQAGSHPDSLLLEPEAKGKVIKIDQVRALQDFAAKRAQFNGFRVIIIAPAEAMNLNAANALLKTLEEPGENALLLLVSHQTSDLLATIRSRCQSLQFPLPASNIAQPWLAQQVGDNEKAAHLLPLANGAPCTALRFNDEDWLATRKQVASDWIGIYRGQVDPLAAAKRWQDFSLPVVIGWLLNWMLDFNRYCAAGESYVVNQDLMPLFEAMKSRVSIINTHALYDRLQHARHLSSSQMNPNPQLLLEDFLIEWARLKINP